MRVVADPLDALDPPSCSAQEVPALGTVGVWLLAAAIAWAGRRCTR